MSQNLSRLERAVQLDQIAQYVIYLGFCRKDISSINFSTNFTLVFFFFFFSENFQTSCVTDCGDIFVRDKALYFLLFLLVSQK